jgi:hypothetical protein
MKKTITALAVATVLAGCDGNPFEDTTGATDPTDPPAASDGGTAIIGDLTTPPGTVDPTTAGAISRSEETGSASDITYDAATDTLNINNLPFDGDGTYDRDDQVGTLNGYAVYENNNPTERRAYKTIFGSTSETRFAIVRTGSYVGFGFGGFVYQRAAGVTLPTSGQATFTGGYSGLRVFEGRGGLEYTTADIVMEVDFEDFDATDAVEGRLTNRQVYNPDGSFVQSLPVLTLATGSISDAGEIAGTAASEVIDASGDPVPFEAGNYYAILSGDPADEIVGVIVVTGTDDDVTGGFLAGGEGITVQETGGFIVTSP